MLNAKTVLNNVKLNWKAGLTVSLVALPLGIALSIASGAGPIPSVITGIWAALVAALLGGSHYNVIGAAGAPSTLLTAFALQFSPIYLPIIAIATGLVILIIWALRFERYLIYIPLRNYLRVCVRRSYSDCLFTVS